MRVVVLSAAVAAGLMLAGVAVAGPTKKLPPSPFAVQIEELHGTKVLLEMADRDYKGHRAAAVKEITAAIHVLQAGHAHIKLRDNVKGGGEPQALSDTQLREAIAGLKAIQKQLAAARGTAAAEAVVAIDKAIKELNIALEIK
jgi:hypothetical protein